MRRTASAGLAGLLAVTVAAGCSGDSVSSTPPAGSATPAPDSTPVPATAPMAPAAPRPPLDAAAFTEADGMLDRRVGAARLPGGVAIVGWDGAVVHEHTAGRMARTTPVSVASAAKWLTAATVLTFVDDHTVTLDEPVGRWLPELAGGPGGAPTLRQLLTHTSGLRDNACLWNTGDRMDDCARRVAAAAREFAPGTRFSYGNAGYHVAGRVLEVLGGADFATVFRHRLGDPLGLAATAWPGAPANPSPAAGVRTTVDDYARFLALLAAGGLHQGRRLLSDGAVDLLLRNQIAGYETAGDEAVGITGIPRYALGAWPDEVDGNGAPVVVSGNGARGFYPWLDRSTGAWGVVGVQDERGAAAAVPASQEVARRYWQAARRGN